MSPLSAIPASGGPFDLIGGLPVHPLVVHAVVVLLPVAALLALVVAFVPRWSRLWGWIVPVLAFLATGAAFVAKESGERLAVRVGEKAITETGHLSLGNTLPIVAGVLFLLTALLWWLDHRSDPRRPRSLGVKIVAALVVVAAVGAMVQTYRVGESGAQAVWGYVEGLPPAS